MQMNLIDDPWIEVIRVKKYDTVTVSLGELLAHPSDYYMIAGESRPQALSILRLALAVLTAAYEGEGPDKRRELYQAGQFDDKVSTYLAKWHDRFDFFGDRPFYQVTRAEFNALVDDKHQITDSKIAKGTGTVAVRQINRTISESGNSPAIFASRPDSERDRIDLPELIRWVITYQNYTGVTDKTKLAGAKYKASPGWIFRTEPLWLMGQNLFETLIFNMVLLPGEQRPVWEYDAPQDYVQRVLKGDLPDNISELYTNQSRLLHIDWSTGKPVIFPIVMPALDSTQPTVEQMAMVRQDGPVAYGWADPSPLKHYLWLNADRILGQGTLPGVIQHIAELAPSVPADKQVALTSQTYLWDGKPVSQAPAGEYADSLTVSFRVLTDPDWRQAIVQASQLTAKHYRRYLVLCRHIWQIRTGQASLSPQRKVTVERMAWAFNNRANGLFKRWATKLGHDGQTTDQALTDWSQVLYKIAMGLYQDFEGQLGPRDYRTVEWPEDLDPSLPANAFEALALYRGAIEHYHHAGLSN